MKPAKKSKAIEDVLEAMFGIDREGAILADRCVDPPVGCGRPITDPKGWAEIELGEYKISGLCPECQKKVFG